MSDTASVEVLTAEVRVLMVGNRQITLSVARQLDVKPLSQVSVFGRVEIGSDRRLDAGPYVIGRHGATGSLVLARYSPSRRMDVFIHQDDLPGKVTVCGGWRVNRDGNYPLSFRSHRIAVAHQAVETCGKHTSFTDEGCQSWCTNGLDDYIAGVVDDDSEEVQRHIDAAAAPLIVLAGLR